MESHWAKIKLLYISGETLMRIWDVPLRKDCGSALYRSYFFSCEVFNNSFFS